MKIDMIKTLVLAAGLLLSAVVPAAAQEEPSAGELAAIRELLEVSRARENFIRGMELGMAAGGLTQMSDEVRQVMRDFMDEHFSYAEMEPHFIGAYADQFTEEEIRAFTAFYRTPAGMRMVERTPELGLAIQQATMGRMMELMPELMERAMEAAQDADPAPGSGRKS
ncbi:MAG TPA: DUF2059 domain-containing protein [Longimicrobium sp.]|nr:DUF2059 domain-containing protein [Longimicrobium sp.]